MKHPEHYALWLRLCWENLRGNHKDDNPNIGPKKTENHWKTSCWEQIQWGLKLTLDDYLVKFNIR